LTLPAASWTIRDVLQPVEYRWRGPLTDTEVVALVTAHGGRAAAGWWDQIRPYSLGWVTARQPDGFLVGFVNVAWDGGDHAFLLDTKVASDNQRRGIATALVGHATRHAKAAGCEWLHVDFEEHLASFYLDACGFRPTGAGLIHLAAPGQDG
jgi:ribosomal protein S18 acetylase RimI-like enzyme